MNTPDIQSPAAPTIAAIRATVNDDLRAVDALIIKELQSQIPLIEQIIQHIVASGGKRVRPLLVLLASRALGYQGDNEHHELAAIIEFVHTATLLHDDVIDESKLRRGQKTANAIWGNEATVLVGDFLYSRAFQVLARRSNVPVMKTLADTTNAIAEGEVLQLMNQHEPDITEAIYLEVIHAKTAKLFESSAQIGAMVATDNPALHAALATYGRSLGMAFQIIDDVLDYTATDREMGKNSGDDLAEGKVTLPLIHALKNSDEKTQGIIRSAIKSGGLEHLPTVLAAIENTNAVAYCFDCAQQHVDTARTALAALPASPQCDAMHELLNFVLARRY